MLIPQLLWGQSTFGFAPSISFAQTTRISRTQRIARQQLTKLDETSRRKALGTGGGFFLGSLLGKNEKDKLANAADATINEVKDDLLADLPMVRLRLPKAGIGREYVALQMKVQGKGPYDFMVDTGLTTELITPHLLQSLGLAEGKNRVKGLAAGGGTDNPLVSLKDAALCCGKFADDKTELPLPTLTAVVTDFPQEHIDPAHDPVEGMLGMEMLSLFDVDFDFPAGRIRFWKPGTAKDAAKKAGLVDIPAVVINESGLIAIRTNTPGTKQPVLGLLDCGATFSALNWKAAEILGFPPKDDAKAYANVPAINAIGIDGGLIQMPTRKTQLTFSGDTKKTPSGELTFNQPPSNWKPWNPVTLAIGDLPVFRDLLGDGRNPYEGPACLIGLDILAQRRVIFETGGPRTQQRKIWVSPK